MPPEAFALAPATTLSGNFQLLNELQAGNAAQVAHFKREANGRLPLQPEIG